MKNLRDPKIKIYPSTTRGGKELPSSLALDSPSVISKLTTPKPTTAMNSDMLHVIDDATSAFHDTYDETISMLDNTVPLGEFLEDKQRFKLGGVDTSPMYLLFQTLLSLFWTLTCMI